ncbi:hypothetical protein CEXT_702161 [Caerostris extrusa]|uniref:Uncharacterized protein n=1 Tax=Caerostris extrusa TaxID=172846 RepID=A0AAV4XW85_CAEEX|nr:hypothetical protein CEXT_702161 [Caerostris extrusa]
MVILVVSSGGIQDIRAEILSVALVQVVGAVVGHVVILSRPLNCDTGDLERIGVPPFQVDIRRRNDIPIFSGLVDIQVVEGDSIPTTYG